MSEPLFQIRQYGEKLGDYQMIDGWRRAHGHGQFIETLLPPIGVIAELDGVALSACWLHLSAGIGVGILEHLSTAPGLSPMQASTAIGHCLEALKQIAKEHDYGALIGFTHAAIARYACNHHGFTQGNTGLVQIITPT